MAAPAVYPLYNKLNIQYDLLPLGWEVQSAFDLEKLSLDVYGRSRWLQKNGKDTNRNQVDPSLSSLIPNGVFTSTARTLLATPATVTVYASPTYFVASAAAGTTAAQYSTDAITWSQTSLVSPASCQVNGAFYNGIRWFFACSGSSHVCVTTGDNPNTTWTECSGETTSLLKQAFAYISSLALTVFITDATSTSCYTIPDGSTVATARTKTNSTPVAICATSNKFFILTGTAGIPLQTSTDGTTWTDSNPGDFSLATSILTSIASDGAQTIVIPVSTYFIVSNDNGVSWFKVAPPQELFQSSDENPSGATSPSIVRVVYINGRFVATLAPVTTGSVRCAMSTNGRTWFTESVGNRGAKAVTFVDVTWKASVYCFIKNTTAAMSATEDMTKFRMPSVVRAPLNIANSLMGSSDDQIYVKVLP